MTKNKLAVTEVEVARCAPSPFNPRQVRDGDAAVKELAASIAAVGLLQPITVRPHPDVKGKKVDYEIVCGERRWRACRAARIATIAAIVRTLDDAAAREICVTENLQREDLTPLEESRGVAALLDGGWSAADVAAHLGKGATWVAQRASLVRLAAPWRTAFEDARTPVARWSARHLEAIARMPEAAQLRIFEQVTGGEDLARLEPDDWTYQEISQTTVAELRGRVRDETRELAAAPWKLDNPALFGGACSTCCARSSRQPELFEDLDDDGKKAKRGDRCLNPECWAKKTAEHLDAGEAAARREHGADLVVIGERAANGVYRAHEVRDAKRGERGARPAYWRSGATAGAVTQVIVLRRAAPSVDENAAARAGAKDKARAAALEIEAKRKSWLKDELMKKARAVAYKDLAPAAAAEKFPAPSAAQKAAADPEKASARPRAKKGAKK